MKKNLIHIVLVALFAVFAFPQQADAQLGGLLKKVKKGVESVTKATGVSADAKAAGTEVAIPSGGTMIRHRLSRAESENEAEQDFRTS